MKLGVDEPKKVAAAGVLLCVAGYAMWSSLAGEAAPTVTPAASRAVVPLKAPPAIDPAATPDLAPPGPSRRQDAARPPARSGRRGGGVAGEWVPTLRPRRPEDRPDPGSVDPALRTDLLARLQGVTLGGGERSLFEFGSAPPKPVPDVKILPGKKGGADGKGPDEAKPPVEAAKPSDSKPPPPPIPLKFYGFVEGSLGRQAFFVNGDDIFAAREGQVIQSRYRLVKIGAAAAEVEDIQHKNKQTIRLEQPPQG
jgi:hypothetical protein